MDVLSGNYLQEKAATSLHKVYEFDKKEKDETVNKEEKHDKKATLKIWKIRSNLWQ